MCCRTSRRFMGLFCVRRERYLRQQHLAKAYNILQPQLILQTKETKGFPQRGGASLCKLISSRNVAEKWAKWTGVRCSDSTVIPFVCFAMAKMHQDATPKCSKKLFVFFFCGPRRTWQRLILRIIILWTLTWGQGVIYDINSKRFKKGSW